MRVTETISYLDKNLAMHFFEFKHSDCQTVGILKEVIATIKKKYPVIDEDSLVIDINSEYNSSHLMINMANADIQIDSKIIDSWE